MRSTLSLWPRRPIRQLRELPQPGMPSAYRLTAARDTHVSASGPLGRDAALAALEAILFVAEEPLPPRKLSALLGLKDAGEARRLIARLRALYESDASAFRVQALSGGYQLTTHPAFHPWLAAARAAGDDIRLSAAARETLTIVAYRQPIMRADIETIRGVQCGDVLRHLMDKGLIRIAGRHDSLGRPVLYGTTKRFLQWLGLNELKDLPLSGQLVGLERSDE
jgi:segregation and condensation protein B